MNYKFICKAYLRTIMATTLILNTIACTSVQAQEVPSNKPFSTVRSIDAEITTSSHQSEELNNKINQLSKTYGISREAITKTYAMERILKRISVSRYCNNFALAGGYLCYSFLGLDKRLPQDMDLYMQGIPTDKSTIIKVLNEILAIDLNDSIKFKLPINVTKQMSGFKLHIMCSANNFEIPITIDCVTKKRGTHKTAPYNLKPLFDNETINISASSLEALLADKIANGIKKNVNRVKDYYDIWALYKSHGNEINPQKLKKEFNLTCEFKNIRNLNYRKSLETMRSNLHLKENWRNYQNQNNFAKCIDIVQIFDLIENIIQRYKLL